MIARNDIDAILSDLYELEPALKADMPRLRTLVTELLASKPDTHFDQRFAKELRDRLISPRVDTAPASERIPFFSRMKLKSFSLPLGAVAVVALAVIISTQNNLFPRGERSVTMNTGPAIQKTGAHAFGALSLSPDARDSAASSYMPTMPPMAGGGLGVTGTNPVPAPATPEAAKIAGDALIYPGPEAVNYRFSYKGELPAINASQTVYKRIKGAGLSADAVRGLGLGLVDLARLSNAKLQSFSVVEDREYGYTVTVDGVEGAISYNTNWLKWPNPTAACRDEACYQQMRLKPEDIPADETVIGIADRFLNDQGISKDGYSAPAVRNEWRVSYEALADKSQAWIPESIAVVYPLMIEGQAAYDESGAPYGLYVQVNARAKRVDGMWNLTGRQFASSSYDAETDASKLRTIIERGGVWGWTDPKAQKTVEIELGAPELVLTRIWLPRADGMTDELYAPALRFPVLNAPADQPWFRDNVTVPLIKELLEQSQPPIMPFVKDAEAR